jgi:hypothetical protein
MKLAIPIIIAMLFIPIVALAQAPPEGVFQGREDAKVAVQKFHRGEGEAPNPDSPPPCHQDQKFCDDYANGWSDTVKDGMDNDGQIDGKGNVDDDNNKGMNDNN